MATSKRATWSVPYVSDRPRDILGLPADQEAKFSNFIGFAGKNQDAEAKTFNVVVYDGTAAPTLTDFAALPVGTVIIAPFLATPKIYVHKTKSDPAVVGDWYGLTFTQES